MDTSIIAILIGCTVACLISTASTKVCKYDCSGYQSYTVGCGWWGLGRCRRTRYIRRTCYKNCPVNCRWSDWEYGEWGECSVTCENGIRSRTWTREIVQEAKYGGTKCTGDPTKIETGSCDMGYCPDTVCNNASIPKENGHGKNYQDCYKFVKCAKGTDGSYIGHPMLCPEGTAWEEAMSHCTKQGLRDCESHVCTDGERFRNEEDCGEAFVCSHNELIPTRCAPDTPYWNKEATHCSADERVCKDDNACSEEGQLLKHNEKTKFYLCNHGGLIEMNCPQGTVFKEDINTCG